MLSCYNCIAGAVKTTMTTKKMRVMRVVRQKGHCEVRIGDIEIEHVDEVKYLGVMISSDGNMEKEVEAR